jgi:hypothetical protein
VLFLEGLVKPRKPVGRQFGQEAISCSGGRKIEGKWKMTRTDQPMKRAERVALNVAREVRLYRVSINIF